MKYLIKLFIIILIINIQALSVDNLSVANKYIIANQISQYIAKIKTISNKINQYILFTANTQPTKEQIMQYWKLGNKTFINFNKTNELDISLTSTQLKINNIFDKGTNQIIINLYANNSNQDETATNTEDTTILGLNIETISFIKQVEILRRDANNYISETKPDNTSLTWYEPDGQGGFIINKIGENGEWETIGLNDLKDNTANQSIIKDTEEELQNTNGIKGQKGYVNENGRMQEYIHNGQKWVKVGAETQSNSFRGSATIENILKSIYSKEGGSKAISQSYKNKWIGNKEFEKIDELSSNGYWKDENENFILIDTIENVKKLNHTFTNDTIIFSLTNENIVTIVKENGELYILEDVIDNINNLMNIDNTIRFKHNNSYYKNINNKYLELENGTNTYKYISTNYYHLPSNVNENDKTIFTQEQFLKQTQKIAIYSNSKWILDYVDKDNILNFQNINSTLETYMRIKEQTSTLKNKIFQYKNNQWETEDELLIVTQKNRSQIQNLQNGLIVYTTINDCDEQNCNGNASNNFYQGAKDNNFYIFIYTSLDSVNNLNNLTDAEPISDWNYIWDNQVKSAIYSGNQIGEIEQNSILQMSMLNNEIVYYVNGQAITKSGITIPFNKLPTTKNALNVNIINFDNKKYIEINSINDFITNTNLDINYNIRLNGDGINKYITRCIDSEETTHTLETMVWSDNCNNQENSTIVITNGSREDLKQPNINNVARLNLSKQQGTEFLYGNAIPYQNNTRIFKWNLLFSNTSVNGLSNLSIFDAKGVNNIYYNQEAKEVGYGYINISNNLNLLKFDTQNQVWGKESDENEKLINDKHQIFSEVFTTSDKYKAIKAGEWNNLTISVRVDPRRGSSYNTPVQKAIASGYGYKQYNFSTPSNYNHLTQANTICLDTYGTNTVKNIPIEYGYETRNSRYTLGSYYCIVPF